MSEVTCPDCDRPYAASYPLWQCSDSTCGLNPGWNEDGESHDDCINECLYATKVHLREALAAQAEKAARAEQETATACARMRAQKAELREQLSAATARASELEKLLAAKWDLSCAECGAQWMHDAALDELSDLVETRVAKRDAKLSALGERVARAERENEAWRELFWHSYKSGQPLDCHNYREQLCVAVESANERETWRGVGVTPGEAALALVQQLGLLQPETKGKTDG